MHWCVQCMPWFIPNQEKVMWVKIRKKCLYAIASFSLVANVQAQTLSFSEAVDIALKNDPVTSALQDKEQAFRESSVAANALPDPQIKLGFMNYPTDTYKSNQEPMTQKVLGVSQMFPAGDSLEIKSKRQLDMANEQKAKVENQKRMVVRKTTKAWLELYYWLHALKVVNENQSLFKNLVNVTESNYAAGRQHQQDVIRAELELELLDDKEADILSSIKKAKAKLAKWIGGENVNRPLTKTIHYLPDENVINDISKLDTHPMLMSKKAMIAAGQNDVELAKQSYSPNWMIDLTYGQRDAMPNGVDRADFLSAMVKFSLPLFTGSSQDRKVAASKRRHNAAKNDFEEKKRELAQMYQSALSDYNQFANRSERYKKILLVKAKENAEMALSRYQSDRGKFTDLIRARMTELNMQLKALRLEINQHKSHSDLTYLVGES